MNEIFKSSLGCIISPKLSLDLKIKAINLFLKRDITPNYFYSYDKKTGKFLPTEYSEIYRIVVDYYNQYNEIPLLDDVITNLKNLTIHQNILVEALNYIEYLYIQNDYASVEYLIDSLTQNYVKAQSYTVYSDAINSTNPLEATEEAVAKLNNLLAQITESEDEADKPMWFADFLEYHLQGVLSGESSSGEISYGIDSLDNKLGKMDTGELIIIVGQPATGKSFMVQHIGLHNTIQNNKKGVIASKEMNSSQVFKRQIAMLTGIPSKKFRKDRLSEEEISLIKDAIQLQKEHCEKNMLILPQARCRTVSMISREIKAQFGEENPDYIIVDYLNELEAEIPNLIGHDKIQYLTSKLKDMATEFNCPVISPSQPNSAGFETTNPTLNDVGYKSITQKADTILFLVSDKENPYIEPFSDLMPGTPGIILCHAIKVRSGAKPHKPIRISVEFATANIADAELDVVEASEFVM
jgi:replicative DNA helicase